MILKHLHRFKLAITSSITRDLAASPMVENSPVSGPKIKKEETTAAASTSMSTVPMLKLVYFFRIMARMSVPPLEAPIWNRIALPKAGRKMAKRSSRTGSVVRGGSQRIHTLQQGQAHRGDHAGIYGFQPKSFSQE